MTYLTGSESVPSGLKDNWRVSFRTYPGSSEKESGKLYGFLADQAISDAKWYARFDDDSYTDVCGLLKNLERFNCDDPWYFTTTLRKEINEHDQLVLEKHAPHLADGFGHEVEGCVISRQAMKQIMNSEKAKNMFSMRAEIEIGYCDVCLAAAAIISGVQPIKAEFLTHHKHVDLFSLEGGPINHIHGFCFRRRKDLYEPFKNKFGTKKIF